MIKKINKYRKAFKAAKLFKNIPKYVKALGVQTVYMVLLLYNAFHRKETPHWAKKIILGTLGYLITPIDTIPDLTPFIGYTDDLGILSFGLVTISCYVNEAVKSDSRKQLGKWFGDFDPSQLKKIDSRL